MFLVYKLEFFSLFYLLKKDEFRKKHQKYNVLKYKAKPTYKIF